MPVLEFCHGIRNHLRDGADARWDHFILGLFRMFLGCCVGASLVHESHRQVPVRVQFGAIRLRVQALVLTLLAAAMANGQADPLQQGYKESARAATPIVRTGVAIYRGQELHYEVIDGLAVHDGDMILGTVEEVLEEQRRLRSTKAATGLQPARRDVAAKEDVGLWPDGIVPYVIDPGFSGRVLKYIDEAINEWNSKTVITLVKRTTELDYVRFKPRQDPFGCSAGLGRRRRGGVQFVNLIPESGCGLSGVIHEIGHAVGLVHEFQRYDRDDYVSVSDARTYGSFGGTRIGFLADTPGRGHFDYSSTMQYRVDSIGTIPPGIPLRAGRSSSGDRLSSGDIDGVARLYGTIPTATTITTNPSGLAILVDGENHTTPVQFNWSPGTTHTLEAVSPQTVGAERFVFGRWSDEGGVRRTISADADATWYEANYIVQRKMLSCPQSSEVGGVEIRPESPDDFYVQRQPVEVYAKPADSLRRFLQWNPVPTLRRPEDRRGRESSPANSSNPATGNSPRWSFGNSELGESAAIYTAKPIFLVDSNIDGIRILAGGKSRRLPWAFPVDAYPNGIWVEAPAVVPEQAEHETVRYRFTSWSDGGMRTHQIRVPASGGRVRLEVTREYRIHVRSRSERDQNAIEISPPSEDGFYTEGTVVRVTANPSQGHRFAGWVGEISGSEPSQTVVMDSAKLLEAVFTRSEPLKPGESKSVRLQAPDQFQLYDDSRAYSVLVPRDSSEFTIRFQSSSVGEVDLYVHRGRSPWLERGGPAQTPRVYANFASASPGPTERITINRASIPRLANDVYFVALAVPPGQGRIQGTLSVEVRRSGIVKSRPRALTFVSPLGFDAGPQTIRLTHEATSTARYKIKSSATWLTASPQEWVSSRSGVQEVSVVTNTAGLSLDTHRASLSVLKASSSQGDITWAETGVEIPVTFAVVPSNPTSATSRRANAVVIEDGPQEGDTYGAGEQIRIAVNFTDPVEVTGLPILNLRVGNRARQVTWAGRGSTSVCEGGYKSLEFVYLVQAEDFDVDGIRIGTNALTLNGGSIKTVDGADSILALGGPLTSGVARYKVDGRVAAVPRVNQVWVSTKPSNGVAYAGGERIEVGIGFAVPVEVQGRPRLALRVGDKTRQASLNGDSSEARRHFWFRYEVQPQDVDQDGISVPADALTLNGGSIRSAAGANADLHLGTYAIENAAQQKVDGSVAAVPRVDYARIYGNPPNGAAYAAGERIEGQVRFSIPVEVNGSPRLALNVGGRTRYATLHRQSSDGRWLNFRYEVQAQDVDADGISIPANALQLNGGSIRSAAGANADLHLGTHAIENAAQQKVDGSVAAVPRVDYARIYGNPPNGAAYAAGERIEGQVRFSIPVEVNGSPRLALNVGGRTRYATLHRQSSDGRWLNFRYEVQAQDVDADGISIPANALQLNGGSIRSAAGANADLHLGTHAIENAAQHKVDGGVAAVPKVKGVGFGSSPSNRSAYAAGESIDIWVAFSTPIKAVGRPRLALEVGTTRRYASFSGPASDGIALWFRYRVRSQDADRDGISIAANSLTLNGGSIRSTDGEDADLNLGSHAIANATDHKVNGGG